MEESKSYFDGGLLQLIGWKILGALVTVCTLGICYPWAFTMLYNWEVKHTVINGKRLQFDGTAVQLFGNWIKWFLLTIITIGIYGLWLPIKLKKWKTMHTSFDEKVYTPNQNESDISSSNIKDSKKESINTESSEIKDGYEIIIENGKRFAKVKDGNPENYFCPYCYSQVNPNSSSCYKCNKTFFS